MGRWSDRPPSSERFPIGSLIFVAFIRIAYFPGGTADQYRALAGELRNAPTPAGRLMFAAGPYGNGWQVVQVWNDRRQLDAFNREWLLPALGRLGRAGFPLPPDVRDFEPVDLHPWDVPAVR